MSHHTHMHPRTHTRTHTHTHTHHANGYICILGQVLFRGRHIFMGYLGMEEKTKEIIDDEGWLHSGDIGRVDQVGCIEGVLVMYCTVHRTASCTLLVALRVRSEQV